MGTLPGGYTLLEYIESSGIQYINTRISPNQDTRVFCEVEFDAEATAYWLFGARNGNNLNTYGFLTFKNQYRSDYNTTSTGAEVSGSYSGKFSIDKNGNITSINGEIKNTVSKSPFSCNYPIFIFANNNNGSISGYGKAKIYTFKIYSDGENVSRDFVPCKNQSGVVGLYDLISNTFFENSGSGAFIPGPELITPDTPEFLSQVTAVALIWPSVECEGYHIYKNGELIGSTPETRFFDTSVYDGQNIEYKITSYERTLESNPVSISVTVKEGYTALFPIVTSAFFQ